MAFPSLSPRFGVRLLKLGIGFSILMVSLPTAIWLGIRLLQMSQVL